MQYIKYSISNIWNELIHRSSIGKTEKLQNSWEVHQIPIRFKCRKRSSRQNNTCLVLKQCSTQVTLDTEFVMFPSSRHFSQSSFTVTLVFNLKISQPSFFGTLVVSMQQFPDNDTIIKMYRNVIIFAFGNLLTWNALHSSQCSRLQSWNVPQFLHQWEIKQHGAFNKKHPNRIRYSFAF